MVNHVNHTTNNITTHTNCNNTAVSTTGDARPMTLLAAAVLTAASLQSLASPQRPALAGLSTPHLLPHSQGSLLLSPPTDPQQRNSDGNILLYSVPAHPTDPHQRDIDSSFLLYPAPSHSTSNDSDYSAQSPQGPAAQTPDPNYPQSPRASSTTTTRSSRSADKCSRTRDHHDGPNSAVGDDAPRRKYKCIDDWPAQWREQLQHWKQAETWDDRRRLWDTWCSRLRTHVRKSLTTTARATIDSWRPAVTTTTNTTPTPTNIDDEEDNISMLNEDEKSPVTEKAQQAEVRRRHKPPRRVRLTGKQPIKAPNAKTKVSSAAKPKRPSSPPGHKPHAIPSTALREWSSNLT